MRKGSNGLQNVCTLNNRMKNIFDSVLLPRQSAVCLVIDQNIWTASTKLTYEQLRNNDETISRIEMIYNHDDHRVKQIVLYDDDPLEMVFSSGICYDMLAQVVWCTFHIVIFLALLIAIRTLFGFFLTKLMRKYKTAVTSKSATTATASATTNNIDDTHNENSCVSRRSNAISGWESEYIADESHHAGGPRNCLSKKSSLHVKRSFDINPQRRACASAGPVILESKQYEFDYNAMKKPIKTEVPVLKQESAKKLSQPISTYYVCVILFCFVCFSIHINLL